MLPTFLSEIFLDSTNKSSLIKTVTDLPSIHILLQYICCLGQSWINLTSMTPSTGVKVAQTGKSENDGITTILNEVLLAQTKCCKKILRFYHVKPLYKWILNTISCFQFFKTLTCPNKLVNDP